MRVENTASHLTTGTDPYLNCPGLGLLFGFLTLLIRTEDFRPLQDLSTQCKRLYNASGQDDAQYRLDRQGGETVKVLCWVMTGPDNHQAKVREGFRNLLTSDFDANIKRQKD